MSSGSKRNRNDEDESKDAPPAKARKTITITQSALRGSKRLAGMRYYYLALRERLHTIHKMMHTVYCDFEDFQGGYAEANPFVNSLRQWDHEELASMSSEVWDTLEVASKSIKAQLEDIDGMIKERNLLRF